MCTIERAYPKIGVGSGRWGVTWGVFVLRRASISKPTPVIYLDFEKLDPFIILDRLQC